MKAPQKFAIDEFWWLNVTVGQNKMTISMYLTNINLSIYFCSKISWITFIPYKQDTPGFARLYSPSIHGKKAAKLVVDFGISSLQNWRICWFILVMVKFGPAIHVLTYFKEFGTMSYIYFPFVVDFPHLCVKSVLLIPRNCSFQSFQVLWLHVSSLSVLVFYLFFFTWIRPANSSKWFVMFNSSCFRNTAITLADFFVFLFYDIFSQVLIYEHDLGTKYWALNIRTDVEYLSINALLSINNFNPNINYTYS